MQCSPDVRGDHNCSIMCSYSFNYSPGWLRVKLTDHHQTIARAAEADDTACDGDHMQENNWK